CCKVSVKLSGFTEISGTSDPSKTRTVIGISVIRSDSSVVTTIVSLKSSKQKRRKKRKKKRTTRKLNVGKILKEEVWRT
ncbi:MAG: hypothetical protein AAFX87_31425, partial [Bacteroidota bacterium]